MSRFRDQLDGLRRRVPEIDPAGLVDLRRRADPLVIDVRELEEWQQGHLEGAVHVTRGFLELRIESVAQDRDRPVVLYCQSGVRSLLAAEAMQRLGYRDVRSLAGGFEDWKAVGHPFTVPPVLQPGERERYSRQVRIPEVGAEGQQRLGAARVAVVGAGGLGSPAALYLAAAGVGNLVVLDHDVVDRSNLQRQVLHTDDRVGLPKSDSARRTLEALNPAITVEAHRLRLERDNAAGLLEGCDVVVDGCDNFATRYAVNDTCVALGIPNVHGSIHRFEGQVSVFWPGRGPCYRCLHPAPPPPDLSPNCAETGVLGVLPGVVGMLEATETVKIVLGLGEPLVGRLLTYDALAARFAEYRLQRDPHCPACGDGGLSPAELEAARDCS